MSLEPGPFKDGEEGGTRGTQRGVLERGKRRLSVGNGRMGCPQFFCKPKQPAGRGPALQ